MSQAGFDEVLIVGAFCPGERKPLTMSRPKKYPDELIERGIRLALESERPIAHIAAGSTGEKYDLEVVGSLPE